MAKLKDAIKNLGNKINNKEPEGYYVTDMLKSFGTDLTGTQIEGKGITDVLNDIADNYTGGGGGGTNLGSGSFDSNGTFNASDAGYDGWDTVEINVPTSGMLGIKAVDSNGTYYASDDGLDGYTQFEVNVPNQFQLYVNNYNNTGSGLFEGTGMSDSDLATLMDGISYGGLENMFSSAASMQSAPMFTVAGSSISADNMFYGCTDLQVVPAYDMSEVISANDMFGGCSNLTEIHMYGMKTDFDISASTEFTEVALVEIINNLAEDYDEMAGVQPHTLTIGSDNLAKLTAEEIQIATDKGWTLA